MVYSPFNKPLGISILNFIMCYIKLFVGSAYIDQWVGEVSSPTGTKLAPDVNTLTIYFLFLYFLMSTQDIAVDG